MRERNFRAKRLDNSRWAYGYFVKTPITAEFNDVDGAYFDSGKSRYCIIQDNVAHEIDVKTVGEFTGLKDKNGKEIYEGDIIQHKVYDEGFLGGEGIKNSEVKWQTYYGAGWKFGASFKDGEKRFSYPLSDDTEVIGNIYENAGLLSS